MSDKATIDALRAADDPTGADNDSNRPPEVRELLSEIAALRSELQRKCAQIERQTTDIVALEKERLRLANSTRLRLAVFGATMTGAPRTLPQTAKHLTLGFVRRLVAQPKVRTVLRRIRNAVRTP